MAPPAAAPRRRGAALLLALRAAAAAAAPAAPLNATLPAATLPEHTVSGFSSGGDMAIMHFAAYSRSVAGAGIVAGAPYGCNVVKNADKACATGWKSSYQSQVDAYLKKRASDGLIDPLSGMAGKPVYLFSGTKDRVVSQSTMKAVQSQLSGLVGSILAEYSVKSDHDWVVSSGSGGFCATNARYDMSGVMLGHFLGKLSARGKASSSRLYSVPQSQYFPSKMKSSSIGMSSTALLYVPAGCKTASKCRVHVHYHGCKCGEHWRGTSNVLKMGFIEWAEPNNIIILFPQMTTGSGKLSRQGCWDWEGSDVGSDFDTKSGKQLSTVTAMLRDMEGLVKAGKPASLADALVNSSSV